MKCLKFKTAVIILFFLISSILPNVVLGAGSISGSISYSGLQSGTIYVAVFTNPILCSLSGTDPYALIEISSLGSYTFPDFQDGTYYVVSVIMACGADCSMQLTDPWGVYGGCDTSTQFVISGGNIVSGIDIILVDGTVENPNPFYNPYDISAHSRHENGEYRIWLDVDDDEHNFISISVSGPGISGYLDLVFNQDRWELEELISFGSTHPAPPVTYTFTIIDLEGTHQSTEVVESFVDVFATNLFPSEGEFITGTPVLSWTGVGDGYTYGVGLNGNDVNWRSDEIVTTTVIYGGPSLTPGLTYYWYVDVHDEYGNLSQVRESFIYSQTAILTVIKDGSGTGIVTSIPSGVDCGGDCSHDYPEGSMVVLSAMPDSGSIFTGWSGGGCGGINKCVPVLSSETSVIASFVTAEGSISGTISYSGSQSGPIYVAAFTSPVLCSPSDADPYALIEISSLGSYTFPDLPDGIYYVGSVIIGCGADCPLQPEHPWGVYGGCDTSTQVVISGGNAVSGIDITLVDGTVEDPNPFYHLYNADAISRHENGEYQIWMNVDDDDHTATFVSVTGPGISGAMNLVYNEDDWEPEAPVSFGSTHPDPPLTYTFSIIDSNGTHMRTEVVESFVDIFATDLSPSEGELVAGTPVLSWTGVGDGYTYDVGLNGTDIHWRSDEIVTTTMAYNGPSLTPGQTYYWYVDVHDAYGNLSQTRESFIYTQAFTLTVIKEGIGSGIVTSYPAGIDCGDACSHNFFEGSMVVLSPIPDAGSSFAGWSGGGCSGIGDCIPDLSSDTIVTADFTVPGMDPITLSVSPESVPADSSIGFTFQTRAASAGGIIMFELFHDFNNNGIIDGNEWPIWETIFSDNHWIDPDHFLSGDSDPSELQMTIDFDFAGGVFPAGGYIAKVTNTIGETATIQLAITPITTSQAVEGYVYEQGTTTPIPDAVVYAINPATESFVSATYTAGDGTFSLLVSEPGDIVIGSDKKGYISDDSLIITVPSDGIANHNIFLTPPDAQITGIVREYYTGNPIWGMEVDAEIEDTQTGLEVVTDISGTFVLPVLAGMTWRVDIEGAGYFGAMAITHNLESHPVIIPTVSGPNRVDFTIHKKTAWIDGTVLDEYGVLAVEEAYFNINRINTSDPEIQRLRNGDETDSSGQVTLGVEAGDWRVNLSVESVLIDGALKEMVPPGQADDLRLFFGDHVPLTMLPYYADGAIEGTVYEADGVTPDAGASVGADSNDALNGLEQASVGQINANTRTDENGHYRLPLLSGTWTIKAWFSDGTEQVLQPITLTTDGNDIIDQPGETITGIDFGVPHINVTPANIDFGSITIGGVSTNKLLTISNTGSRDLEISNIELTGTDLNMFNVTSGGCQDTPFTLSPNSNCTLSLTFSPTSDGPKSAIARISSNDISNPSVDVPLTGTGIFPDSDNDDIPDDQDNCPTIHNPNQEDGDNDTIGDVCDNCPSVSNIDQEDSDGDFTGDVCDNCPSNSNPNQEDGDADSIGDACDNCPALFNINQQDSDNDGVGDFCDLCLGTPVGSVVDSNGCLTPNLQIGSVEGPLEGWAGQQINISWSVINTDNTIATDGFWQDCIYLSDDDQIGGDTILSCLDRPKNLGPGEIYSRINSVPLPEVEEGSYWLIAKVDSENAIIETDETDNDMIIGTFPIYVAPKSDLSVVSIDTPPLTAPVGSTLVLRWIVQNIGQGATNAQFWYDQLYLSTDTNLDENDYPMISKAQNATYLGPNENYEHALTMTIPGDIPIGNYFLIALTDVDKQLQESDESNNWLASYGQIEVTAQLLPDLVVVEPVEIAPTPAYAGDQIMVSWTGQNIGQAPTTYGNWANAIFLSGEFGGQPVWAFLGNPGANGDLSVGQIYEKSSIVTLPVEYFGTFRICIALDGHEVIPESNELNQIGCSEEFEIILPLPSDLVIDSINVPETGLSGQSIHIEWTVRNAASQETHTNNWQDEVWLSADNDIETTGDNVKLGSLEHTGGLNFDGTYTSEIDLQLPADADGNYYLFVCTDAGNVVFEGDWEDNNCIAAPTLINIEYRPPDLESSNINVLSNGSQAVFLASGNQVMVTWTVANSGPGDVPNINWIDGIYISEDDTLDSGDKKLSHTNHLGSLAAGENYVESANIIIPVDVTGSAVHVFVCTDLYEMVYESSEVNNCAVVTPFEVVWSDPDLILTEVTASQGMPAGKAINVSWQVKNLGGPTTVDTWTDKIFLSENRWLDESDIELGDFIHSGSLSYADTYSQDQQNIIIPEGLSGSYYVIITTDAPGSGVVTELDESNNIQFAYKALNIGTACDSDLVVSSVEAPDSTLSGQLITLDWSVINQGDEPTNIGSLVDVVYLSLDQYFDRESDIYLGFVDHHNVFEVDETYLFTSTEELQIPTGLTGPYYVFVVTDSNNAVCEINETNNTAYDPIAVQIEIPPPVDLVVADIVLPPEGNLGETVTIQWMVRNSSVDFDARGTWHDAVYISSDATFDIGDKMIGKICHAGPLAIGEEYTESITAPLPGVIPDAYYTIIRTDIYNEVRESVEGEQNNITASTGQINVQCWELALGVPDSSHQLNTGDKHYFMIPDVPEGEDLSIAFDCAENMASTKVYVRYEAMPDTGHYDFSHSIPFAADHEIIIPYTQSGTYYILVIGDIIPNESSSYTINGRLLAFDVQNIEPLTIGNSGNYTLSLDGSQLTTDTIVSLLDSEGIIVFESTPVIGNSTEIFTTLNLTGVLPGVYDLQIEKSGETPIILEQVVDVITGYGGRLEARIILSPVVRTGTENTLYVEYTNIGDADLPAPLFAVSSLQNVPMRLFENEPFETGPAQFLGISFDGPAGTLQPGKTYRIPVQFQTALDQGLVEFNLELIRDDTLTMNWEAIESEVRPVDMAPELWDMIWSNLVAENENTRDLMKSLTWNATYFSRNGTRTYDLSKLLQLELDKASGAFNLHRTLASSTDAYCPGPGLSLSFKRIAMDNLVQRLQVGPLGRAWSHSFEYNLLIPDSETVMIKEPGGLLRVFTKNKDGIWQASEGDFGILEEVSTGIFQLREKDGIIFRFEGLTTGGIRPIYTDALMIPLSYIEDSNGNRITLNYLGDRLTEIFHSSGDGFTLEYDTYGCINRLIDQAGRITIYSYDADGEHLLNVTAPGNLIQRYTYIPVSDSPADHALQSIEFPDGTHRYYAYDSRGRLEKQSKDDNAEEINFIRYYPGMTIPISWGPMIGPDRVIIRNALNAITTVRVDDRGNLLEKKDPLGNTEWFEYDEDYNLTSLIRSDGNTYGYDYDNQGNLVRRIDPIGNSSTFIYEPNFNQISSLRDHRNNTTNFSYDLWGNLISIQYPDSKTESFSYDSKGNLIDSTNRRGTEIEYTYNEQGLLIRKDYSDNSYAEYTYDERGNMLSATNIHETITMSYDDVDRMTLISYSSGRFLEYTYNSGGRRSRMVDQDGFVVNYLYDFVGRLSEMADADNNLIVRYTYDSVGRLSKKDMGNGTYTIYEYDAADRIIHLVNYSSDDSIISRFDYTYDKLGLRKDMQTIDGQWTYEYDAIGQLTRAVFESVNSEIEDKDLSYIYDESGNRIRTIINGVTTDYSTNNMNQYSTVGTAACEYDNDGNLISKTDVSGQKTYLYDNENRLTDVVTLEGTWNYEYDALGNRIAMIFNGQRTEYLNDPVGFVNLVGEYNGEGSIVAHFIHGLGLIGRVNTIHDKIYYNFDAVGNTSELINSMGEIINKYSYQPFGKSLSTFEQIANPFGYIGELGIMDAGNNLFFMRARYYHNILGRFLSEDPIKLLSGDLNFYRYSLNSPPNFVDPSGLFWRTTVCNFVLTFNWNGLGDFINNFWSNKDDIYGYNIDGIWDIERWLRDQGKWQYGMHRSAFKWAWSSLNKVFYDSYYSFWTFIDRVWAQSVGGVDPNDKISPQAFGEAKFVSEDYGLQYTINFENMADASGPAQQVYIIDQLSEDFDWRTFQLGEIVFGDNTINSCQGRPYCTTEIMLDNGLLARINAGLNIQNGTAQWTFTAINPETGEIPENPLIGLLPPNDPETHSGEGHITFFIRPKSDLTTGSEIKNKATIIFDTNEPIETNEVFNTIDADLPSSLLDSLPAQIEENSFTVTWSGHDATGGSGLAGYDIYVSDNGAAYSPWVTNTSDISDVFTGEPGHTYRFYSLAKDNVGNVENPPASPDAVIFIMLPDTDNDGLPDNIENIIGCPHPDDPDSDDDGLLDGEEDANHDGIKGPDETDPCDADTDDDKMPDGWEVENNLNPLLDDALGDADQDGFSNIREYIAGTDPSDENDIPYYNAELENFETGDFKKYPWLINGDNMWMVTGINPFLGGYSAESPVIGDNQAAFLEINLYCEAGEISFEYSIDSEENNDFLTFYIDGILKDQWSGNIPYTFANYSLTTGMHNFVWSYSKDNMGFGGNDKVWLDEISFPGAVDTDSDGMPDGWELENDLDPFNDDTTADSDGDLFSNHMECLMGTDPQNQEDCPAVSNGFDADFDLDGTDLVQFANGLSTGILTGAQLQEFANTFGK